VQEQLGHSGIDITLLGLSSFEKKTQKTPDRELALAKRRLSDWRERGR
jgi:phage-related protein